MICISSTLLFGIRLWVVPIHVKHDTLVSVSVSLIFGMLVFLCFYCLGRSILITTSLFYFQEMTSDAHVISTRYTKSVIKSCAALSYVEAQARMDDRCMTCLLVLFLKFHS